MNEKTEFVFNGWLALNEGERADFANAVGEYSGASVARRRQITEAHEHIMKMQTGPLRDGCPCCGR
jgi:hypothetical protein